MGHLLVTWAGVALWFTPAASIDSCALNSADDVACSCACDMDGECCCCDINSAPPPDDGISIMEAGDCADNPHSTLPLNTSVFTVPAYTLKAPRFSERAYTEKLQSHANYKRIPLPKPPPVSCS